MKHLFKLGEKFHGLGRVLFAWQPHGSYLATCGSNGLVYIFDRHGNTVQELTLASKGECLGLEWDAEGDTLAILQQGISTVSLWDVASQRITPLETNQKDPSFIKWSMHAPVLAIGTDKGNLVIYRTDNRKKIPVIGKHSKRIISGCWSLTNQLALGSEDHTLSLSDINGDMIEQTALKSQPLTIEFATQKTDRSKGESKKDLADTTVSVNMGGNTILLYNLDDPENPIELAFQERYGDIVTYKWFGDGYMMIGFSDGFVVVISTHLAEIGEELYSCHLFKSNLNDVSYCPALGRAAAVGDNCIKIIENSGSKWKEIKGEATFLDKGEKGLLDRVAWTTDGQILTVSSRNGIVYNFLAQMPSVFDCCGGMVAYLSSLREITIVDVINEARPITISVDIEPVFVALGSKYVAVGMNNRVWFYRCTTSGTAPSSLVLEKEYLGTVTAVKISDVYAAVLCEGRVFLHALDAAADRIPSRLESRNFPEKEEEKGAKISCLALTPDFLIYGTDKGSLEYFFIPDWVVLAGSELRHECGIVDVVPNHNATRVLFRDKNQSGFVYNPVISQTLPIPKISSTTKRLLWDEADWGCFVTVDSSEICTYLYSPTSMNGPQISKLGNLVIRPTGDMAIEPQSTPIPSGFSPIHVFNGIVSCQNAEGTIETLKLATHTEIVYGPRRSAEKLRACFTQNLALLRLRTAWEVSKEIKNRALYLALSGKAMEQLNVPMALMVYRELGDAGMVMGLEAIQEVEDRSLLAGHMALLFADYTLAQELFLASSRPVTALEMRRDLLHWEHAMKLASTLAPEQVSDVQIKFAQHLEFQGDFSGALMMFESSLGSMRSPMREVPVDEDKLRVCIGGTARMSFRMGDLRKGLSLVMETDDKKLALDCAAILEGLKQFQDAALLYEKAESFDKAAEIYIMTKNFDDAEPLMEQIKSAKLHGQYGKAMEALGQFERAAQAFERAKDADSVVRLCLTQLNLPEKAFAMVRKTNSSAGAEIVAQFCQSTGNFKGAIEFLLMANRSDEAFELAKTNNEMDCFASLATDEGATKQSLQIAAYYEGKADLGQAGDFYVLGNQFNKALSLYLQCGEEKLDKAIDLVGKARSEVLTHTLVDYLAGESDGITKDPNYMFRLYMALGNYPQAARTAIIISRQEQEVGNYKVAHDILFETHKDLLAQRIRIPSALTRALLLLHSYSLVKKLVKLGDHLGAARMLIRVSQNISKFPFHVVQILTSTVIECHRAKLKLSALEYAKKLMRPEYRPKIAEAYKRKIDNIVRKPAKEEVPEENTPCPFCKALLPESELQCGSCKNNLQYCVATGLHVLAEDYCLCPSCNFPARFSKMKEVIAGDGKCPMCEQDVSVDAVVKIDDPTEELRKADLDTSKDTEHDDDH